MTRLAGKVAVITGTAGGQGRAAAELFAREGAAIVGCDVKVGEAAETAEAVRAAGGTMVSLAPCDLSTPEGARELVELAMSEHGRIDVLYNNASRPAFAPIDAMTDEQWRFTIANELDSVFYVCRAAWPHLAQGGGASIVNTASLNAQRVVPKLPAVAHTAAKSGVMALTRQLAIEGAPAGIRANSISPGIIRTPATEAMLQDAETLAIAQRSVLLDRLGEPEDVAYMALFLASDESSWITGADFLVDGGGAIF
jgi:meso-butanediol dehydrogenase / (S,S)-butanediol dehydrogenase / diacetyl reductase